MNPIDTLDALEAKLQPPGTQPPADPYAGDNSFVRGIRSGGFGAGSQLSTLAGAVGETLGADQFAKAAYAKGRGLRDDASRAAPLINQWADVHGAGDFGSYVAGQVGASLPAAAGALGAAALTGGGAVPAMVAAGAAMAPLEIGDMVQRQHDRGEATDLGTAALYGGGSAALQGIVPGMARVKLGGGLGASARQTLRQAVVKESAAIPEQAALGTAGEGLKQYGTTGELDPAALGEAAASNAVGGLPFAAAGVAGRMAHGGAGVPGSQMVGDAFAKGREALKKAPGALRDAVPRTESGGIDLGGIKESVRDTAQRVADGLPMREHLDKIRTAAEDMLPETAMAEAKDRMAKVQGWAGELVNDAGLTPERRAEVAQAAKDLTKDANVKIVAGAKAAQEAGRSALGAIGDFYKSVTEKFAAGKTKVGEGYEGGIDVGPKQSRVYGGMRQAIANIIAPIVEQNYPQALRDPEARNRLAEALRVTAERMSQGKEIPAEHQRYMRILFGDEYTDVLGAIGEEMVDSGKTPKFLAQLNKLDAAEAEGKSRRQRLTEALPDHTRGELDQIDEQLQRFMSPEFTRGLDRATAELRLRNARRQIAKTFGDKADVILEAYGPQAREENQLQAAGRPLEADKADDGVDFTDRLEEGGTNVEVVSKKPVLSPDNAMKEYGDAPGQTKAEREIARAEKREGVRARWVSAAEYAALTGKDASDIPEGHGFVVAETLPAGDALSARELAAMKWDKQKQSRDASKNDTLIEIGPHKFDATKIARVMLATLPSDERGSQVRMADAFMQGVAKLTEHFGDVVNIPDSMPIVKNGKKTLTYGEAKKLNLNGPDKETVEADAASDASRNEAYAKLAELRKRWKEADPKRREFLANEAKKIGEELQVGVAEDQIDGRMDFEGRSNVTDLTRQDAEATKAAGLLKELRKRITAGEMLIETTDDAKLRAKYRAWVKDAESEIKRLEKVDARRGANDEDAEREVGRDEEIHTAANALTPSELRNKFSLDGTPSDKGARAEPMQYDPYQAIAAARKSMEQAQKALAKAETAQERAQLRAKIAESNANIGKQEAAEGQITPAGLKVLDSALATMKARIQDAGSARDTGSAKVVTQSAIERNAYTKLAEAATQHIATLKADPGALNSVQTRNLIAALHPDQKLSAAMELMPPVKARPAAKVEAPARDVLTSKPKLDAMVASENYSALDTRAKVDEFLKRAEARYKELSTERDRLFKTDEDLPAAQQAAFEKLNDMFGEGSMFDRESLYDGVVDERVVLPNTSPYTAKDQAKSDRANKFIGRGSSVSSTNAYAKAWGDRANTGEYSAGDKVFVSAEGSRNSRKAPDLAELGKATAAGATIITDNPSNRNRSFNVGEREVAKFLAAQGYVEDGNGTWSPGSTPNPKALAAKKAAFEKLSDMFGEGSSFDRESLYDGVSESASKPGVDRFRTVLNYFNPEAETMRLESMQAVRQFFADGKELADKYDDRSINALKRKYQRTAEEREAAEDRGDDTEADRLFKSEEADRTLFSAVTKIKGWLEKPKARIDWSIVDFVKDFEGDGDALVAQVVRDIEQLKGSTPDPKALAAKKAAFLERARSGDKALIEEIGASTDIKGMQRAIDALPADAAPGVVDAFNARMGELLRDPNNAYGAQLKKYSYQAVHVSNERHSGEFDWRSKWRSGQGEARAGAGTYLMPADNGGAISHFSRLMESKMTPKQFGASSFEQGKPAKYNVTLNAEPSQIMLWDEPLSKQPVEVQEGIKTALRALGATEKHIANIVAADDPAHEIYGYDMYNKVFDMKKVSDALDKAGVVGSLYRSARGPEFVIYRDSLIQNDSVEFSRQRTNPNGTTTPQQRAEVTNYIRDVLGPQVKTVFANIMHAGEFEPGRPGVDDIVRVSVHSLNPMSVAYHESLHGLFARLMGTGDNDVINVLKRAADGAVIKNQLRKLLAGEPDALRQLEDPEERAAYMYQFWATKDANGRRLLEVGTQTHGVFERIKAALLKVLGVWTNDERALHIMESFHDGKFKDPSSTSAAARVIMAQGHNATLDKVGAMTQPLRHLGESIVAAGGAKLRETGVPALSDVANGMKRALHDEGEDQGFVPAARTERTLRMNKLAHALESYTPDEMNEALVAMQSGTKPASLNARVIARVTKNVLREAFTYMKDAGVKLNDLGEDYFPRVYDTAKIEADRVGFESMLTAHGYDGRAIADKLIANGGVYTNVVDRPGMQHTKQRKLVDIPDALVQPYLKSDFVDTMSSYMYQATRRAEWARRWGDEGERLEAKLGEARRQGATPEQLDDARKFIRGVDGTLGDDINPNMRKLFGTAIAYQNIRLLPLAIFSSVVDPVGIIVRGGTVREGWSAFKRGMKEAIPAARGTLANDHWAEMAEIMGVVDAAALSHTMGEIYGQGMMGDTTRKINDAFFRFNLMEGFNRSMRVAATEAAARFIGRHADLKASEHSARWIAELGLRPEDILRNPDGSVKLSERDGLTPEQAGLMRAAVNKWVDGAVLRPDSVDKPVWMNDPHWALVSHLKQFTYAFHETILKRVIHEHKFGNYKPAMAMASYVPIMIAADLLKSGITPNDPEWDNDAGSMLMHGVERGGVLGVGQFALDMGHGLGGLTGPTIEQLIESVEVLGGRRSFQSFALRAMPANSLYVGDGAESAAKA